MDEGWQRSLSRLSSLKQSAQRSIEWQRASFASIFLHQLNDPDGMPRLLWLDLQLYDTKHHYQVRVEGDVVAALT